ncbi:MAG TPA: TetR/AcrR family transcriptional regulator [Anaerolineaceae bacterium]
MPELDPNPSSTRRDRQIQRKRQEILAAATQVFARKGYASTTTKDIANEADLGESTLYNYFESKRDILLAILEENHVLFDTLFEMTQGLANRNSLIELFDRTLEIFSERIFFLRTILSEAWVDNDVLNNYVVLRLKQASQLIEDFIAIQIKAGVFRPIDPAMGSRLALGMFFSLVLPALRGIEPPPSPQQRRAWAESVVSFLLDGIRTRVGESA